MKVVDMNALGAPGKWPPAPRPGALARCRFEMFPAPGGVLVIFAEDYDAAKLIFQWVVGEAMSEKDGT
jgi:hypothetical protein